MANQITVRSSFQSLFGVSEFNILGVSGRANIIGEHTDYNDGFVFPFAISQKIYFAFGSNNEQKDHVHSLDFNDNFDFSNAYEQGSWQHFFKSALHVFHSKFSELKCLNLVFGGDLPIGAGISSSSALCCGFVEIFDKVNELNLSKLEKVNIASEIEHGSGLKGGKMDQYAITFGIENKAVLLDCKTLIHQEIEIPKNWTFLLLNTGVKHNLVNTSYNERRAQCESVVKKLSIHFPNIKSLRDVNKEMLYAFDHLFTKEEFFRALFVMEENNRVHQFYDCMKNSDIKRAGHLLNESHVGLATLYDVSCEELNYLHDLAFKSKCIIGSRMMGGGFGGCTINLCHDTEEMREEIAEIQKHYFDRYKIIPEMTIVRPSKGVEYFATNC